MPAGFELDEWVHLVLGVVNVFFGVLGGFYAFKALVVLHRSPEMLKSQRAIWLPILIGGGFFAVAGLFHFAEHSYFSNFSLNFETGLLSEAFSILGLTFITISVIQYSKLQIKYYRLKREALQKMSEEHKQ